MRTDLSKTGKLAVPLAVTLAVAFVSAGCVTKAQADARARIAFLEGQNQALMRLQSDVAARQSSGPGVTFTGPVQNLVVPWRIGLTLAQAIVSAQYTGTGDPSAIVIHRNGEDISFDPKGLLNGEDFVLQIGDMVEIKP